MRRLTDRLSDYRTMATQLARLSPPLPRLTATTCALIFSAIYLPITLLNASRKQFWNDELFTYYIARLSPAEIWNFLLTGVDQNPPLFYLISRAVMALPLDPLVAMRLPEVLGFWIAGVGTIIFLSRYVPAMYGLLASALLLVSNAYPYAYEARPYGIVAGFATLALISWQHSQRPRRWLWTVALGVSLAGAVSMHYYSVLIAGAIAVGELVRTWFERTFSWRTWIALVCGISPIIFCLPLIAGARTYSAFFWSRPRLTSVASFFSSTFEPAAFPIALLVMLACVLFLPSICAADHPRNEPSKPVPLADVAAVTAWAALPIAAVVVALTVTGAYNHRYVLSAAIATCIMAGWAAAVLFGRHLVPALCAVLLCFASFVVRDGQNVRWQVSDRRPVAEYLQKHTPEGLRIAIADPLLFFELSHQASDALRSRLLYFADPNLAIRYTGTDTVDRGVIGLSKIAPLRTEVLADVLASGQRFAIYGYPGVLGWLVPELAARKVRTYVAGEFDGRLLLIARPDATAASTRYGSVNDERQQVIHLRAELAQTKHLRLPDETSKTTGSRQALSPLILLWKHVSSRLSGSRGEYE